MERPLTLDGGITFRQATEADHARLTRVAGGWWDERPPRIERLWFRHFALTSVVGEAAGGRLVALAVGFRGSGTRGVLHLVAVAPAVRRRGVGRALVAQVEDLLQAAGVVTVEAIVWPGNRAAVRFLQALGYEPVEESRSTPLYGVPAIADYDGEGEDRAVLERSLA